MLGTETWGSLILGIAINTKNDKTQSTRNTPVARTAMIAHCVRVILTPGCLNLLKRFQNKIAHLLDAVRAIGVCSFSPTRLAHTLVIASLDSDDTFVFLQFRLFSTQNIS